MAPLHSRVSMALAIAASTAVALTGCSNHTSVRATADAAPASGVDVTAVRQVVDSVKKAPTFSPPGPAFDASKVRGKTMVNVTLNSTVPFNEIVDTAMGEAAKAAGVNIVQYTTRASPRSGTRASRARSPRTRPIVLEGSPDPKLLGPQIAAAKAAGIPVISTHLYDESFTSRTRRSGPARHRRLRRRADHYRAGTLMADYAIVNSGGRVNVYFVTSNEVQPAAGIAKAFEDELAALRCPDTCKAEVVQHPDPTGLTKAPPQVQTALPSRTRPSTTSSPCSTE